MMLASALPFWLLLALGPQAAPAELGPALEKLERKDYLGALADLQALAEGPGGLPMVHYQIGVCQTLLGRYPEALESFGKAQEAGLDGWELWSSMGIAAFNLGDQGGARRRFERVLQARPEDPTAHYYLGRIDLNEGRYREAEEKFRRVLAADPAHESVLFSLGRSLVLQKKTAEGKRVLEQHRAREHLRDRFKTLTSMAAAQPGQADTWIELAAVQLEMGDRSGALSALEKAEAISPGSARTGLVRGRLSYLAGDLPEAEGHLQRYLLEAGSSCDAHLLLGLVRKNQRQVEPAWQSFQAALDLCPRDVFLLAALAELELQRGNLERASALAQEIMQVDQSSPQGPFLMAVSRLYQKDVPGAQTWALKALQLEEANPEHHRLLRAIYTAQGELEKAAQHQNRMEQLLQPRQGARP